MLFVKRHLFLFLLLIVLLVGCNPTDNPFVTASISPAGPDDFQNLIDGYISISLDGSLILSNDESYEADEPTLKIQLSKKDIREVEEKIKESNFKKLPDDVSVPLEDGSHYHIQVNFLDESKKVEGWNPDDETFNALHHYLFSLVDDDEYDAWLREIEEYIIDNKNR